MRVSAGPRWQSLRGVASLGEGQTCGSVPVEPVLLSHRRRQMPSPAQAALSAPCKPAGREAVGPLPAPRPLASAPAEVLGISAGPYFSPQNRRRPSPPPAGQSLPIVPALACKSAGQGLAWPRDKGCRSILAELPMAGPPQPRRGGRGCLQTPSLLKPTLGVPWAKDDIFGGRCVEEGVECTHQPQLADGTGETTLFVAKPLGSVRRVLSSLGFAAASHFSSPRDPVSPAPPPARRWGAVRPGLFLELPLQQSALRAGAQRGLALMSPSLPCSGAGNARPSLRLLVGKHRPAGWDAGEARRDATERDSSRRSRGVVGQ